MKQITEGYCSFEIAKLLKEKGFKQIGCEKRYNLQGDLVSGFAYGPVAPLQSIALKWLREVHNVLIHVNEYGYPDKEKGRQYTFVANIRNMKSHIDITQFLNDSYEEACEAALKFTLENLI